MHPLAAPGALWVLSRAGKVPRPPAGGRNLPQAIDCLWMARKRCFLAFSVSQRVSPLRRRPKGFPIALWKPSAPLLRMEISTRNKMLPCFFRLTGDFASAEATKGLSDRPLETFGPMLRMGISTRNEMLPCFSHFAGFRLCGGDQRAFRSPFGNLRPLCCGWKFAQKWIVPRYQSTVKSVPVRRFRLPGTLLFSCSSSATQRP